MSTAYYAVFHAISDEAARPYRRAVQPTARRLLDHGQIRDVADTLLRRRKVLWLPGEPTCDRSLTQFAADFIYLHAARHQADYNLTFAPPKADTTTTILRAERALRSLEAARNQGPDQLQAICVAMTASTATRKRMTS
jgi:hypothetical protein